MTKLLLLVGGGLAAYLLFKKDASGSGGNSAAAPSVPTIPPPTAADAKLLDDYVTAMTLSGRLDPIRMAAAAALAARFSLFKTGAEMVKVEAGQKPAWPVDELFPGTSWPMATYVQGRLRFMGKA